MLLVYQRGIQNSQKRLEVLSKCYSINKKTVAKWRKPTDVQATPMGSKVKKSTILSLKEEAIMVTFRKHMILPLDNCLYAIHSSSIPNLTGSYLHSCLQCHSSSRLLKGKIEQSKRKKFKEYLIGYFNIAELRTEEGKLYMFVAIDRT